MFRNDEDHKDHGITTVNCLLADSGMGDLLCAIMPINYILNNCPWINLLIWVPDYMTSFCKNVLPKSAIIRGYTDATKKYDPKKPGITTKLTSQHTPTKCHPIEYAYHMLCDISPTLEQQSYLKINPVDISKFKLPEKFIVIQGAYAETVKTMPPETFNKLTDYVIQKGYTPVYLGKTENKTGLKNVKHTAKIDEEYDLTKGINLLNKTDLIESASIIDKAELFIGMDGGLTHLAGFTDTNIISGYTFAKDTTLMPIRDGTLGKNVYSILPNDDLKCKFCQSNLILLYDFEFRSCLYGDYVCVKHMTFEKFKNKIEENSLL